MGKIGFINICHSDYVTEKSISIADRAVESLKGQGIDVSYIKEPVTSCKDAEIAGRELVRSEVDGVILLLGTWIESPVAMSVIREVEHLPMCLWGFPTFKDDGKIVNTGSYVSFAMFKGTMDRIKYRYKPILGVPGTSETTNSVSSFCRAASALSKLKRTHIGLVGYTSMGIYPGTFDHVLMRAKIGPEIHQIDSYTLINTAESIEDSECDEIIEMYKKQAQIRDDVSIDSLKKVSKLYLGMKKLMSEMNLQSINVKCQYEFSKEYKMVPCVPLSLLADTGVVASCEGDIPNTVSMIILNLLTGDTVTYGDALTHSGNVVKLSACGFMPFSMGIEGKQEIRKFMPHPGFNGIQSSFVMRPERVTVMRLVEDIGTYHILYFTGQGLDTELRDGYMPALDVKLDGNMEKLVQNYAGQHFAICYGDISAEIEDLARILGIQTVKV